MFAHSISSSIFQGTIMKRITNFDKILCGTSDRVPISVASLGTIQDWGFLSRGCRRLKRVVVMQREYIHPVFVKRMKRIGNFGAQCDTSIPRHDSKLGGSSQEGKGDSREYLHPVLTLASLWHFILGTWFLKLRLMTNLFTGKR